MQTYKYLTLCIVIICSTFFSVACNSVSSDEPEIARAIISAEFLLAESGEALSETTILISAAFDESENLTELGTVETDEDGRFETTVNRDHESVITLLEFAFEYEDQTYTLLEEVNLQLGFEDPYDQVELNFEVEIEENDDDDENGDES